MDTLQSFGLALVSVLPGASYTFAYERIAGGFGATLADRTFRFLAASAIFLAIFFGPGYVIYRDWVVTGRLTRGEVGVGLAWLLVAVYVVAPIVVGSAMGYAHARRYGWALAMLGASPEPRAWDHLWRRNPQGIVRMRLRSGTWLAGFYGTWQDRRSYAAGFPEEGDLYLSVQVRVDAGTGQLEQDGGGRAIPTEGSGGLLVRWAEIEYLEILE